MMHTLKCMLDEKCAKMLCGDANVKSCLPDNCQILYLPKLPNMHVHVHVPELENEAKGGKNVVLKVGG